jgi:uncharacterized protein YbjT (DUF2867 family)
MISAITGAGGRLGRRVVRVAQRAEGDEVRQLSDFAGNDYLVVDLPSGNGLREALAGVEVVVHTASSPRRDPWHVDVVGARHLAAAVDRSSLRHLVFISIVGVDRIPYDYYHAKFAAEQVLRASGIPLTIVRSTQFHSFVDELFLERRRGPLVAVPSGWRLQPVDTDEVAEHLWQIALGEPTDEVREFAGPEELASQDVARLWAEQWYAEHRVEAARRPRVVPVRLPGKASAAFRKGHALPGLDAVLGRATYAEHLARTATADDVAPQTW